MNNVPTESNNYSYLPVNTELDNTISNNASVNDNSTIIQMANKKSNIPVDVNSNVPHHLRWDCEHTPAPKPVPNGGLFGGPQAEGEYASIHVVPTATNMINKNLLSANPPPGATTQYPGTNRSRNNYIPMPGVYWYNDTHPVNKGPFSMKVTQKDKNYTL